MPSLKSLYVGEWGQILASSDEAFYRVLERLRGGLIRRADLAPDLRDSLPELKAARLIEETAGGVVVLTDAGWRHLAEF